MPLAAVVAVSRDPDVLDAVQAQLVERYAHDYRIESLEDPDDALALLETLADDGVEMALLLATSTWTADRPGGARRHAPARVPGRRRVRAVVQSTHARRPS